MTFNDLSQALNYSLHNIIELTGEIYGQNTSNFKNIIKFNFSINNLLLTTLLAHVIKIHILQTIVILL